MSPHHPQPHEDFLRNLLLESDDPRRDLEESEFRSCAMCRSTMEELLSAHEELQGTGEEMREVLDLAQKMESAPGEDMVDRVLGKELGGGNAGTSLVFRLRVGAGALLAAAAVFLFVFWISDSTENGSGSGGSPPLSGGGGLKLLRPVGEVESFREFVWEGELGAGEVYTLSIHAEKESGGEETALVEDVPLSEPRFVPSRDDVPTWVRRLTWEVQVLGASGDRLESMKGKAWLRQP